MTTSQPHISVIIPAYNAEACLAGCLDSILAQSFKNLEIIIVNDASTDKTQDIIEDYKDKFAHIKSAVNTENRKAYESRWIGFRLSTGAYIAACDADDIMPPDSLTTLVNTAEATGADIVHGRVQRVVNNVLDGILRLRDPFQAATGKEYAASFLRSLRGWELWGKLYRRALWDSALLRLPQDRKWGSGEDLLVSYTLALAADKYVGISTPVYGYRQPKSNYFTNPEHAYERACEHMEVLGALNSLASKDKDGFPELTAYVSKHILRSIARNIPDDPHLRHKLAEPVTDSLGSDYFSWICKEGIFSGRPSRANMDILGIPAHLIKLSISAFRYARACGIHELCLGLFRIGGVVRRKGMGFALKELSAMLQD